MVGGEVLLLLPGIGPLWQFNQPSAMPRNLYSPRLSDDVVRRLYREAKRRGLPMTRLADLLLRQSLPEESAASTEPTFMATPLRIVA